MVMRAMVAVRTSLMGTEERAMSSNKTIVQSCFTSADMRCKNEGGSGTYELYGTEEMVRSRVRMFAFGCFCCCVCWEVNEAARVLVYPV